MGQKVNRLAIPGRKASKNTHKEWVLTVINLFVFGGFGAILDVATTFGYGKFYSNTPLEIISIMYLPASLLIALFIHDVYFYASHRLLHLPLMLKYIHMHHHQSHTVNAWSAFSFHPVEGFIQIFIVLIPPLVMPIHPLVHAIFIAFLLFMTVYGHSGYELRAKKPPIFNIFNTSFHHSQHHEFGNFNFGIYLNVWDRFFKTNHPTYVDAYQSLKDKINGSKDAV
ncbi:MAG: sterol desaturase family protein [Bacteroidota bacterium]